MPPKSKQKIACAVNNCQKEGRADKIKEHYQNFVVCDEAGNPLGKKATINSINTV